MTTCTDLKGNGNCSEESRIFEPDHATLKIINSKGSKLERRKNPDVLTIGVHSEVKENIEFLPSLDCPNNSYPENQAAGLGALSGFVPVNVITSHLQELFLQKFPKWYTSECLAKVACRWGCANPEGGAKLFSPDKDAYYLVHHYQTKHKDIHIKDYDVQCQHCKVYFYHELILEKHLKDGICVSRFEVGVLHSEDNGKILTRDVCMNICEFCEMIFLSLKRFKKHLHEDERGCLFESLDHPSKMGRFDYIECKFCGETFLLEDDFFFHMKPFTSGTNLYKFVEYMESGTDPHFKCKGVSPRIFSCPLCPNKFQSETVFRRHIFRDHELEEYDLKCDRCDKRFRIKSDLELHNRKKERFPKCFELKDCRTVPRRKRNDERPHGLGTVKCPVCLKSSENGRIKLLRHLKRRHPDYRINSLRCTDCTALFLTTEDYEDHITDHLTKWKCPFCEKPNIYLTKKQLNKHCNHSHASVRDRTPSKPQVCQICNKVFSDTSTLETHISFVHSSGLNICPFCGEKYANKRGMLKHMHRVHVYQAPKSKTFVCHICGSKAAFSYKDRLERHIAQVHNSAEKTECDICHKTFAQKATMMRHRRIHLDIKPFKCGICELTFTQNAGMNAHRARHYNKDGTLKSAEEIKIQVDIIKQQRGKLVSGSKTTGKEKIGSRKRRSATSKKRRVHDANADEDATDVGKRGEKEKTDLNKYAFDCKNCDKSFVSIQRLSAHRCTRKISRSRKLDEG